jgi:hypothetical protein
MTFQGTSVAFGHLNLLIMNQKDLKDARNNY